MQLKEFYADTIKYSEDPAKGIYEYHVPMMLGFSSGPVFLRVILGPDFPKASPSVHLPYDVVQQYLIPE